MTPTDAAVAAGDITQRIRVREKLSYAVGDIGSNLIYLPATTFILFYLTNVAGIGAAIAGTVILIGQLLNGVTDLLIGYFIDKTDTRWGKTRPWILWSSVPLAVSFVLLFSVPAGLPEGAKVAWTLVFYSVVMAVFYTASNVAYSALLSVLTPNPRTRVTLTTFRFFAALLTSLLASSLTLPLIGALGNGASAWTTVAAIYSGISVLAFLVVFFGTRERVASVDDAESSAKQSLRVLVMTLVRNKYFFLAAGLFLGFYLLQAIGQAGGVYLATDVIGDAAAFSLISIVSIVPALIGLPFMPALMGRIGKRNAFLIAVGITFIGFAIALIDPTSLPVVLVSAFVRGLGLIPFTAGLFAIVADVVDYGEWRFGVRTDGLIYSCVVFGQKLGGGLGAAIGGWVLAGGGYVATAGVDQSAGAVQAILALNFYLPLVITVLVGVVVFFSRVERHQPEIQAYLARHVEPVTTDPV